LSSASLAHVAITGRPGSIGGQSMPGFVVATKAFVAEVRSVSACLPADKFIPAAPGEVAVSATNRSGAAAQLAQSMITKPRHTP
jgi:hypothetical protein